MPDRILTVPDPIEHEDPIPVDLPPPTAALVIPDAPYDYPDHFEGTQDEAMEAGYCPSCLGNGQPAVGEQCQSCLGYGTAAAYAELVYAKRPATPSPLPETSLDTPP